MKTASRRRIAVFLVVAAVSISLPSTAWAATPGAPTALIATPGNAQVALAWTAPSVTGGGGGITTYNVEHSLDGMAWTTMVRSNSTTASFTVTGLTNTKAYQFRVSAVNGSDVGSPSTIVTSTPFVVHGANDLALFSACPTGLIPDAGFSDISSANVNCIAYYGITKGTTATTYSPLDSVTRWQMALFLTRLADRGGATLPSGAGQGFADIGGYSAEIQTAVNQLKQLGITVGKTATTYAPADNVTREEMALFISRLLKKVTVGPGGNTEYVVGTSGAKEIKSNDTDHNFVDLPTGLMEARNAIVNLWNLGVTDVPLHTSYEPSVAMTRKMMATFMANALAHSNARPAGLVIQSSSYRTPNGTAPQVSVTHRTSDFVAIANTYVDTFSFQHSTLSTVTRFDTGGQCTQWILLTPVSSVKCSVDAADPRTDANGNLASFLVSPPNSNKVDVWAWTATPTTVYDNDLHAAGAVKMTFESYG